MNNKYDFSNPSITTRDYSKKNENSNSSGFSFLIITVAILLLGIAIFTRPNTDANSNTGNNQHNYSNSYYNNSNNHNGSNNYHTVCPNCGGIGVEYQQQQYYDAVLGWQWMSVTVNCGVCGGTGYIN